MADLSELFTAETPQWMTVEDPRTYEPLLTDDGREMRIAIWAADAAGPRALEKQLSDDLIARATKAPRGRFTMPADLAEAHARRRFMARIADWEALVLGGEEISCTDESKKMIFDEPKFSVLRRQIEAFMADEGNFLASTSANTSVH